MKLLQSLSAIFLLLVALINTNLYAADNSSVAECSVLYAGQHSEVGSVCITVGDDNVLLDYLLEDGWMLTEAHAWISDSLANLPTNGGGNPKVGLFPHSVAGISGVAEYSFDIPITDLLVNSETFCSSEIFVAAHAVVKKQGKKTESAWAGTTPINAKKGSWATYFSFTNNCEPNLPAPTIALTSDKSMLTVGETATITFTLSAAATDFILSDVFVSGGVLSAFTGSGANYTAVFTPTANSTVNGVINVPNGAFSADGIANEDGADVDNTVTLAINTVVPVDPNAWLPAVPQGCVNAFARGTGSGTQSFIAAGLTEAGSDMGWIINPPSGSSNSFATLTDGTNNYGTVQVNVTAGYIALAYVTTGSAKLSQLNAYVGEQGQFGRINGEVDVDSLDPAMYGNSKSGLNVANEMLVIAHPGGSVEIVAHAVVCGVSTGTGA